jgi:hypothetical protein
VNAEAASKIFFMLENSFRDFFYCVSSAFQPLQGCPLMQCSLSLPGYGLIVLFVF